MVVRKQIPRPNRALDHQQIMLTLAAVALSVLPAPRLDLGPGGCTSTTLRVCSGHGRCSSGMCFCDRGFSGPACEHRDYLFACPANCSAPQGGGRCVAGRCICAPGRSGDDCADVSNVNCSFGCSGHGHCVEGQCSCRPGFYGHACAQGCPGYMSETTEVCSGRGMCVPTGSPAHSPDRCNCFVGSSGEGCEHTTEDCPRACSGRGACKTGKCVCVGAFTGTDCSIELRSANSYALDSHFARLSAAFACFLLSALVAIAAVRYINGAGERRLPRPGKPLTDFS